MKQVLYSKTLLSVYRYLERICGAIDKLVDAQAKSSFGYTIANISASNAMNIANKIIDYTERKITLINLKLLIENALVNMDKKFAILLINKYINNKSGEQIQKQLSLGERSYYRKVSNALKSFGCALSRLGYPTEKLDEMLQKQVWIKDVYERFEKQVKEKNITNSHSTDNEDSVIKILNNSLEKMTLFT